MYPIGALYVDCVWCREVGCMDCVAIPKESRIGGRAQGKGPVVGAFLWRGIRGTAGVRVPGVQEPAFCLFPLTVL